MMAAATFCRGSLTKLHCLLPCRVVGVGAVPRTFPRHFSVTSPAAADRLFTSKHEWVLVEKGEGTVGITDYAQKALGDIVYAQLPDPGNEVKQEEECGALESVKAASEIYSPVSGTVTEKNVDAEAKPQIINRECYKNGWLYKVHLSNPSELDSLMKEKAYDAFVKSLQDEAH
ncbi:putative Glycine cleavage system H protein, mitochondrial [Hypsibius exemplaris]|uniref:Glycine cleavage system H protein n=1 Tax=Hypsibius exemplaris TaxID=2072580 RepID=A0A9X6NCF9_HYPEX|nr:putative Glycine cleavage system H protein, mitochondrial [Hypsibius exemplaris]